MAAIMAAPTSEYICPYDLCSQKNRDYSNVQDLVLDRHAAINAAIILMLIFQKYAVIASCEVKKSTYHSFFANYRPCHNYI